jgi:hypothetical protein
MIKIILYSCGISTWGLRKKIEELDSRASLSQYPLFQQIKWGLGQQPQCQIFFSCFSPKAKNGWFKNFFSKSYLVNCLKINNNDFKTNHNNSEI